MGRERVVWVDMRRQRRAPAPELDELGAYDVQSVEDVRRLDAALRRGPVVAACFDFDRPEHRGLEAMRAAKRRRPEVPILMLTEQHSESLAVWAFRARVWDYLVKPLKPGELGARVDMLASMRGRGGPGRRVVQASAPSLPPEVVSVGSKPSSELSTAPALAYMEAHFHEPIQLADLARLCHTSTSELSRRFKREHGRTFREHLLRLRLNHAKLLLRRSDASVTDVAMAVGFQDPSYFTRVFRRSTGVAPSRYQRETGGRRR